MEAERQRARDLKGLLASVDFTFTGHRTDRRVTYAPAGGARPKSNTAIARFTNCIVTVVWSDGINRTPPALFTFNGKFRLDRVGRQTWIQEREKLVNALVRFGIDAKRILYIGAEKNETRIYQTRHLRSVEALVGCCKSFDRFSFPRSGVGMPTAAPAA